MFFFTLQTGLIHKFCSLLLHLPMIHYDFIVPRVKARFYYVMKSFADLVRSRLRNLISVEERRLISRNFH